jgi:GMP synthase (glutamine-hydrolysing)
MFWAAWLSRFIWPYKNICQPTPVRPAYQSCPITYILYSQTARRRLYPIPMAKSDLRALVLSHVPFEDLGSLQPALERRGCTIETADAATAEFPLPQAATCDLLVVLGGPIGVYESDAYPFLTGEIEFIRQRLEAKRPVLGICLGAQLMAAALGARVYSGQHGAEIGWAPVQSSGPGQPPQWFAPLVAGDLSVFHWHGDTFDLPAGATPLAKTELYENQTFMVGDFGLGLQFHPEVTAAGLERWYVGHAFELSRRGVSVAELRAASLKNAPALERAAERVWEGWLDYILSRITSCSGQDPRR